MTDTSEQPNTRAPYCGFSPLLPRPLCSDGPLPRYVPRWNLRPLPVTSPAGHGSAPLREPPLIYGKCGFHFGGGLKCFRQHLFQAAQRPDKPLNIPAARTGVPYLSFVHSCADHRPVLLALLTIVFTVKLRDKLTLCYRALKT